MWEVSPGGNSEGRKNMRKTLRGTIKVMHVMLLSDFPR